MGTTLVSAWIAEGIASLAHVGDSRAYLWSNDELEPLTQDHSLVDAKVRAGLLTREESLQAEQQNVLLRALGLEPEVEHQLRSGDVVLIGKHMLLFDGRAHKHHSVVSAFRRKVMLPFSERADATSLAAVASSSAGLRAWGLRPGCEALPGPS